MNIIKRIVNNLKFRKKSFLSVPFYINNKIIFGLKKALEPYIKFGVWVQTIRGAKIFLGKDVVDEYILKDLYLNSEKHYFPDYLNLQKNDYVLDVGGHHGLFAIEVATRYPGVFVISIEPDKFGCSLIRKNLLKNKLEKYIEIVPFAVGTENTIGYLSDNSDGSWGKTVEKEAGKLSEAIYIKSLEQIIQKKKIKFIKSNCEGGEFELIPQVISLNLKPELIILMIHPERGDQQKLVKDLENYGYNSKLVWDSSINPCWHFTIK